MSSNDVAEFLNIVVAENQLGIAFLIDLDPAMAEFMIDKGFTMLLRQNFPGGMSYDDAEERLVAVRQGRMFPGDLFREPENVFAFRFRDVRSK